MKFFYRMAFKSLCAAGRILGGVRYNRIHDVLGRRAYTQPEFSWVANRWGAELNLSPHYHIDRNIIVCGCYDESLHLALERLVKPSMVCMDVGANLGEMTLHMARLTGDAGKVYAFEPVASVHERLKAHVARNKMEKIVRISSIALSDAKGECEIAYAGSDADNQGLASIVNLTQSQTSLRQKIKTMRLDDFVAQEKLERLDLIKIDIQGAEFRFLKGAAETLKNFSPDLLMEISPEDLAAAGKTSRDLCELIENLGYSIFKIQRGEIGRQITASTVAPDFSATNVYCSKKSR